MKVLFFCICLVLGARAAKQSPCSYVSLVASVITVLAMFLSN